MFQTSVIFISLSDYNNESETVNNKTQTGLKIFKAKINLNHNIHVTYA